MIKRLRVRFVALSMLSLLAVLTIIMVGINVMNFRGIIKEADDLLVMLVENEGRFPEMPKPGEKNREPPGGMSPELPFETRFFFVLMEESGAVLEVETGNIAAVDEDMAVEYAHRAEERNAEHGFVNKYRFIRQTEEGCTRIIFVDCGRSLDSGWDFLLISFGISLAGCAGVFLLILFFSSRIIRPIAESYEKQKRFITDAGHELKTPLTIIHADADVLEMELGENEWLEDIQKQVGRLTALTNDLVYLARMEESESSLQMIEFPVSDVVEEVASSFQRLAQAQNKRFTCRIQPMLALNGDERAIQQLADLLLDNALKYAPEGGKVSITLERQNKALRLTVFNTTENKVERETLPHFFDRFYRADPSRNSQTRGHGIGLSIAQAIVTAHNGKIQVSTQDEASLLVTVTLPL